VLFKILDRHYKIGPSTDHLVKFHAGRPTHLRNLALKKKLEIWGKAQRESARRPKSDWEKLRERQGGKKGGGIFPASKSRGPNSNVLAYAERALST